MINERTAVLGDKVYIPNRYSFKIQEGYIEGSGYLQGDFHFLCNVPAKFGLKTYAKPKDMFATKEEAKEELMKELRQIIIETLEKIDKVDQL